MTLGLSAPWEDRGCCSRQREGILEEPASMHLPEDELQHNQKCSSHSTRSKSDPVALWPGIHLGRVLGSLVGSVCVFWLVGMGQNNQDSYFLSWLTDVICCCAVGVNRLPLRGNRTWVTMASTPWWGALCPKHSLLPIVIGCFWF